MQILSFFTINPHLKNYLVPELYQGSLKKICIPSLNCWSCPAASFSCPIGAIQNFVSYSKYLLSFYTIGTLAIVMSLTGRFFCGFVCPFGFLQDIIHKIPAKKVKIDTNKSKFSQYFFLIIFVFFLPWLTGEPWFSKICPSGFFLASIPFIIADISILNNVSYFFYIKTVIATIFFYSAIKISRPFCQYVCPIGTIFETFRPFSFSGIKVDKDKCIKCKKCFRVCIMDASPYKSPYNCIQCGKCIKECPTKALTIKYLFYSYGDASYEKL